MNHIHAEYEGYSKSAFFHGYALQFLDFFNTFDIEHATGFSLSYETAYIALRCLAGDDIAGCGQVELSQFFIECHFCHYTVDAGVHFGIGLRCLAA